MATYHGFQGSVPFALSSESHMVLQKSLPLGYYSDFSSPPSTAGLTQKVCATSWHSWGQLYLGACPFICLPHLHKTRTWKKISVSNRWLFQEAFSAGAEPREAAVGLMWNQYTVIMVHSASQDGMHPIISTDSNSEHKDVVLGGVDISQNKMLLVPWE